MKKHSLLVLCLSVLLLFVFSLPASFEASTDIDKGKKKDKTEEFLIALKTEKVGFDLAKGKQERDIYNDQGEYLGTIGIEPVLKDNDDSGFSTMGQYELEEGRSTWKVYWYTVAVNMSYYLDLYFDGKYITIEDAYDEWYLFSPPLNVESDELIIENRKESWAKPAKVTYEIKYTSTIGGSALYRLGAEGSLGYLLTYIY